MTATLIIVALVPVIAVTASLARRKWLADVAADARGIALQTVIVMVVLLSIAGGVAAVLLTRGEQAISEVERQNISVASRFTDATTCGNAGFTWDTSTTPATCK